MKKRIAVLATLVAEVTVAGMTQAEIRELCRAERVVGRDLAIQAFSVGFKGRGGVSPEEAFDAIVEEVC